MGSKPCCIILTPSHAFFKQLLQSSTKQWFFGVTLLDRRADTTRDLPLSRIRCLSEALASESSIFYTPPSASTEKLNSHVPKYTPLALQISICCSLYIGLRWRNFKYGKKNILATLVYQNAVYSNKLLPFEMIKWQTTYMVWERIPETTLCGEKNNKSFSWICRYLFITKTWIAEAIPHTWSGAHMLILRKKVKSRIETIPEGKGKIPLKSKKILKHPPGFGRVCEQIVCSQRVSLQTNIICVRKLSKSIGERTIGCTPLTLTHLPAAAIIGELCAESMNLPDLVWALSQHSNAVFLQMFTDDLGIQAFWRRRILILGASLERSWSKRSAVVGTGICTGFQGPQLLPKWKWLGLHQTYSWIEH